MLDSERIDMLADTITSYYSRESSLPVQFAVGEYGVSTLTIRKGFSFEMTSNPPTDLKLRHMFDSYRSDSHLTTLMSKNDDQKDDGYYSCEPIL